jgi:MFS family permease
MPIAGWFAASTAGWWVFLSATLYWAAGLSTAPAWNTWIEEIIPRRIRAPYFACRSRISQFCTLLGFVAGGIALQMGKASGGVLTMFGGIFLTAAVCRYFSAWCLSRQSESPSSTGATVRAAYIPLRRVFADSTSNGGKLIWYLLAVQTAVQISGPYFTPYLLSQQRMSYLSYMVLIGIAYVGKTVALPFWGRVAQAGGARRLLWIGGTAIVPISGLWLFSDPFEPWQITLPLGLSCSGGFLYLVCVQVLSGIAWAAYELAMLLMFFEAIPRSHRTSMLTLYNFGNSAAMVAGGLIGATILQLLDESHAAYLALFGLSSVVRLFTVPVLAYAPSTPKKVLEPADSLTGIHVRTPISPPSIRIDVSAATPATAATEPHPIRRSA